MGKGWIPTIGIAGLATAFAAWPALAVDAPAQARWYRIETPNGAAVGYASQTVTPVTGGREIVETHKLSVVTETGGAETQITSRLVRDEDASGRALVIRSEQRSGDSRVSNEASIVGDHADIFHQTAFERRTIGVELPKDVRFDGGEGLFKTWNPAKTPKLAFENFDVDALGVERVEVEAVAGPDATGAITLIRRLYDGDQLVGIARMTLDHDRRIVSATQPMFGASLTLRAADRDAALASHGPYSMLIREQVASPFRIPARATHGHIRYRFGFRDGLAFALPQTGEQKSEGGPGLVTVDICEACGPGLASDAATLRDALKSTAWLQSDDPRLHAIADPIVRMQVSDTRKMELLVHAAQQVLVEVNESGHYSALEAIKRHSANCSETAVVLAALGRAAGIPTRVANGLIYTAEPYFGVSNAFIPHSWTLAYVDGQWKSFDAAMDVFDSTHIALTVGDGDERSVLAAAQLGGVLQWKDMAEVRSRPAS